MQDAAPAVLTIKTWNLLAAALIDARAKIRPGGMPSHALDELEISVSSRNQIDDLRAMIASEERREEIK